MQTTRETLLVKVRDNTDAAAWTEFHGLYAALIESYARERGLNQTDASEVASECMQLLFEKLPAFQYDRKKGRFRAWLRRVVNNRVTDLLRKRRSDAGEFVDMLSIEDHTPGPEEVWDKKWQRAHMAYCLGQLKALVSEKYFEAFKLYALEHWPVERVSQRLNMSTNEVYVVKTRLIQRLRKMIAELDAED